MKRTCTAIALVAVLATTSMAQVLTGTWKAKTMGSKSGSLTFNKAQTFRLILKFPQGRLAYAGTYSLKGEILTLVPTDNIVDGKFVKMKSDDVSPMTLTLTWHGEKRVVGVASRKNVKVTRIELWK